MKKTISMVMTVLATACAAFGETYEKGLVCGPIVELGDEVRTIDGNGAIVDGGGTNRCATLGPNVKLVNFTFRNGRAAVGGGVWGGAVSNCTIEACVATEYGAAVANCKVSQATITGCTLPLSSSRVAIHGGIAADSTLDGVTVSGCRVELGTTAPGFGGIAANSALSGCTVTDNTFVISGDHYGLLFYGGSIVGSTIKGNSVSSARSNVAAYMRVTPDADCALDPGDVPPGPEPVPVGKDAFTGNASYVGWLRKDGVVVGTVEIKAGKASGAKGSKVTISVTPLGGKKTKLYSDYVPVGEVVTNAIPGLTLAGSIVSGKMNVGGEECEVISYNNPLKSSDRTVRQAAKLAIPTGTWTFSLADEVGLEHPFSVTVANTAKAKFTGYQADGRKLSFTVQGVYEMESKVLHVPVSFAKNNYTPVSFLMAVSGTVASVGCVLPELSVADGPLPLKALSDGFHAFMVPSIPRLEPGSYLNSPSGEVFTVSLGKWRFDKAAGKYVVENGVPVVKPNSRGEVSNLSSLKLKCAAKTGVVTGSFKLHWMNGEKVKKDTASVYGIVIHDAVSGLSVVKKKGAFPAWSEKVPAE